MTKISCHDGKRIGGKGQKVCVWGGGGEGGIEVVVVVRRGMGGGGGQRARSSKILDSVKQCDPPEHLWS